MLANVTFHQNTVEETAKKEETTRHLYEVRFNLAREKNAPGVERHPRAPQPDRAQTRLQIME